ALVTSACNRLAHLNPTRGALRSHRPATMSTWDEDVHPINATDASIYVCNDEDSYACAHDCVDLLGCDACGCAVQSDPYGPWGRAMDVIMCLLPILFLIIATVPPFGWKPMPTSRSLPLSAFLMFMVRLMYLASDPLLVSGSVILGLHEALTPLSIMAGAICLFETMESTNCLPYMMREMKALTGGHGVAELCVIFAFATMVEGASGFGTPVALGAPMLISLGHPKFESVVTLLLANTFATVFGAAGTPIWFGFGSLGLSESDWDAIGFMSAVALCVAAFLLLPFIFGIVVPFKMVKGNILFALLSVAGTMLPLLGISVVSYEFPSLVGGIVGLGVAVPLITYRVGLKEVDPKESVHQSGRHPLDIEPLSERSCVHASSAFMSTRRTEIPSESETTEAVLPIVSEVDEENDEYEPLNRSASEAGESNVSFSLMEDASDANLESGTSDVGLSERIEDATDSQRAIEMAIGPRKSGWPYFKEFLLRTSPITLTVLLLIITRIPQIGLNELLKKTEPAFSIYFGSYAIFRLSASLVFQLEDILTYPGLNWKYELLYTPFIIPFVLVSVITYLIYRKESSDTLCGIFGTVYSRVKGPAVALAGALTLVQLMTEGGVASPASIIGIVLSDALKGGWIAIAASIGALGSFFSGSTTVSNLTFGSVQQIAATSIGVNVNAMLALQVVGASAGNGICLNNIISACTVTGLTISEGKIIAKTWKFVVAFIVIATLVLLGFLF
ncbi:hypothetical protein ACHAXT_011949, partial [Thalassiosira profunda]